MNLMIYMYIYVRDIMGDVSFNDALKALLVQSKASCE